MFHHTTPKKKPGRIKPLSQLTAMVAPEQLLLDDKRQELLQKIADASAFEPSRYQTLGLSLIHNFINYVQSLPETSNGYYASSCGLLDHALNRTEAALHIFRQFIIEDDGISEAQKQWLYALFSASILQGIGKLYIDYRIELYDSSGESIKTWHPLLEELASAGTHYDYQFTQEGDDDFRRRLNILLARQLMPEDGFAWIASHPEILRVWLALIHEDWQSAGTLGAILIRADAIAIQRYFSEFLKTSGLRGGRMGRISTFIDTTPESLADKERLIGAEFIMWLMQELQAGRLMVNKSPLFMVPGGMLMSTDIFKLFVREHPEFKNWQAVQNAFVSLELHSLGTNGSVISRYEQSHTQNMISGVVFSEYAIAMPDKVQVQNLNTGQVSAKSATDLIYMAQYPSNFIRQQQYITPGGLQRLSAAGEWRQAESPSSFLKPGSKQGV